MTPAAQTNERILGLLSAAGVFCIWSGFLVFSRAGMQSGLTPFDLTALRFMVSGALVLPFAKAWWPRHLPLHAILSMSIFGPGALYNILMYFGLKGSSAAYGGAFANGSLPIFTILLGLLFVRRMPSLRQLIAVLVLLVGAVLIGVPGMRAGGNSVASAIAFFLAASAVLSIYFMGVRHWQVEARQALVLVSVPNALLFLPVWFLFLPSTIHDAPWSTVLLQAAFQGLGPGFLAVILFSISARILGPTPSAGLAAAVPASATLLAIPILSEIPTTIEWIGIAIVTAGLVLLLGGGQPETRSLSK
ncbi:DMT family transporter [Bradyrhizobium diversitatis]|uniref:DMT family transporter n=1 Tax=Bradyrhizobium diversitatis TaxID=2755406 RepID=A0ABS0NVJ7_9BRAD|nr:DMT family transporter [Bradyrhizobium diversitatis]MBH5384930.1 DMT family transporter [Bradyrhizobium diversitatis]